ncbi:Serine/threonine-protein phosphatase 6 regulatory ankyrin repeat subunit B [Aphelenchoides bicaudatus]|nr:Serine/threonine-protein phosphatase 6 regulatory ankyrin repeat subunit B [Aphelenchoides bicaudatus]
MRLVLFLLLIKIGDSTNITFNSINETLSNFNQQSFDQLISKLGTNWTDSEQQETLLHVASENGYYEATKALIQKDRRLVNYTDKYHRFPLHIASLKGRCNIIKLLLENNANPNALAKFGIDLPTTLPSVSALQLAASTEHTECVRTLLNSGSDISHQDRDGVTALHIACQFGRYETAKTLIDKSPHLINVTDNYNRYPIHYAAWNGRCDIIKLLLESNADVNSLTRSSESALYLASKVGNVECARILLSNGADINRQTYQGYTSIHVAAETGNYEVAKLLLERGANINATDDGGITPLHAAARHGRCNVVLLLLDNDADVNALAKFSDDDLTASPSVSALYFASKYGHAECVRILLNKGSKVDQQDRYGKTSLHIAAQKAHYDVVKMLVEKGANTSIRDNANKRALDLIKNKELVDYLTEKTPSS